MKKWNKLISVLLAVCMALGLLTISAGASSMNKYLPAANTLEDSAVIAQFMGSNSRDDVYFCLRTGPWDGATYNVGLTTADGRVVGWLPGLVPGESGVVIHVQPNVMYELRVSLAQQPAVTCRVELTTGEPPERMPEGFTWRELRDGGLSDPDYIYDKNIPLAAASTWQDSEQVGMFLGTGGDVYIYALSGPEGGRYNIGYSIGGDYVSGWYPDLSVGQSGAVIHTYSSQIYQIRASAAPSSGDGTYRLIISRAPIDLSLIETVHPFTDVPSDYSPDPDDIDGFILMSAVLDVYANGWMTGTSSTTFSPDDSFNRAMLWTVLARMNDVDTAGGSPWYGPAQKWAMDAGISDGTSPDRDASLQEVITMLYNQAGQPAATTQKNIDAGGQVADWARDAMTWALSKGLIQGGDPAGAVTRGELAVILAAYAILTA